jgi:hypothetical protein
MAKHKIKAAKTHRPSQADLLRLGPSVAAVKAQTDPKSWKAFVKRTHKAGYSVVDTVNGVPAQLRGRTQDYLKKTAASQIATAYAPIDKNLNDAESRVKAWDAKRATDNKAYQQWVADQTATMTAAGRGADAALADRQQALADSMKAELAQAQGAATANVQGQQGTVSDMSQSNALKGVGASAALNAASITSSQTDLNAQQQFNEATRSGTNAAILASTASYEGKRQADTSKALSDIMDQRSQANVQRAADYISAFSKLQDNELTKAQGNRDSDMAAQQLNLNQEKLTADQLNKRASRAVTKRGQTLTAAQRAADRAQRAADNAASRAISQARIRLDQKKADLNADGKVDAKDYKLKKEIDAQNSARGGVKAGKKALTPDQQNKYIAGIQTARGIINDFHAKPPKGATIRQVMRRRGYSDNIIDLGEDLRKHHGKLSPRGRAKAKALGIDPAALEA